MAYDFPSSPSTGTRYIAPNRLYVYEGSAWSTRGNEITPNPFGANLFRYRTIYTRGYTSGGYKDGSPWRNVNRTVHSTDITTNLGDMLDYAASYKTGGFSDYYHYIYGETNSHNGSSNYTGSINMSTESNRTHSSSWDMTQSRQDAEALMNPNLSITYIVGGGSSITDKHNMITETMYVAGSAPDCFGAGGDNYGVTAIYGEFRGYVAWGYTGTSGYMLWSTEVWTSQSMSWNTGGQPKGLSSKHGYGYGAEGGYAGTNYWRKYSDITGSAYASNVSRPETCGEENCQVGQDWGYTIGSYNGGGQTNNTTKLNYLTDTCTNMGSDTMPKGHDGMSSGCCGTASTPMIGGV